ncbi:MAG TPA: MarR family transcriptional regulator [Gemmatimonadaceae bacterium]
MDTDAVSRLVAGRSVSHLDRTPSGAVVVHFADGARLTVYARDDELAITFGTDGQRRSLAKPGQPSARQREYLQFIIRYLAKFGISPAEGDIQRHFMVSAPSVNQMVKTLERRGLIARARDFTGQAIPRSIRVVVDVE